MFGRSLVPSSSRCLAESGHAATAGLVPTPRVLLAVGIAQLRLVLDPAHDVPRTATLRLVLAGSSSFCLGTQALEHITACGIVWIKSQTVMVVVVAV